MSELPARLRDAVKSPTAFVAPTVSRCLLRLRNEAGELAWSINENGHLQLPSGEPHIDDELLFEHTTAAGFQSRWQTRVFAHDGSLDPEWIWLSPAAVQERWQQGEVHIEEASLQLILGDPMPGVENAYGVRSLPLKTPTLPPATHTNLYRVGPVSPLLLDPGSPYADEIDAAVAAVDMWRSDCGPPQAIFLTHHHIDHVSGAESLRARLGLPVWAHRETAARVKFEVDREIEDGERLGDWTAIHTPGHAPGHLCLWNSKTRQLVAGDMVASIGTIVVEPIDGDMSQYLGSLRLLRELPAIVAYPAHGAMIDDPSGRFDAYLSHRLWREERIVAALLEGEATSAELTGRAYTDVNPAIHWLAEQQALAHLLKLQAEGRASLANDLWSLRPAPRP